MRSQKNLIYREDWSCLIILDACRYDYFENLYEDYLPRGRLKKVLSEGSSTAEWLRKTFNDNNLEDVIYVSANAFINSQGANIAGFDGRKHFFNVIDVWDKYWNNDLKTILPEKVRKTTLLTKAKFPDKRIITHFMQPHYPYLSIGPVEGGLGAPKAAKQKGLLIKTRRKIGRFIRRTAGLGVYKKIKEYIVGTREAGKLEKIVQEYGEYELKQAYMKNLIRVLKEARKILERYPGKVVITADHGELLGEDGYGHPTDSNHHILREVPWWGPD